MKGLAPDAHVALPARIYAVGDVHGQADQLEALHAAISDRHRQDPVAHSLLVHLGDYVDRGPDSSRCLEIIARPPMFAGLQTVNLMGNHERMMLDALASPSHVDLWLQNGGSATLASFGVTRLEDWSRWRDAIPPATLAFLGSLVPSHITSRFVFVHAGVRPGIQFGMQSVTDLLWIRREFLDWDGIMLPDQPDKIIVHGHTPRDAPEIRRNRIGIDTNAVRGGKLTCAVLETESVYFLQV